MKCKYLLFFLFVGVATLGVNGQTYQAEIDDDDAILVMSLVQKFNLDNSTSSSIQPINMPRFLIDLVPRLDVMNSFERDRVLQLIQKYEIVIPETIEIGNWKENDNDPILKYFYKNRQHFITVKEDNFKLNIDPILNVGYGNASEDQNIIFQNTRGVKAQAIIDDKVSIYTAVYENQARFQPHVEELIATTQAIPGNGLYKTYNSAVVDKLSGWDYLNAQAHITIPISKSISFQLGHGQNKIGDGFRSLLLSDFGNNYFFGKFDARFWKFHYQTIYAELSVLSGTLFSNSGNGSVLLPKKFTANHYLTFRANNKLELGVFESVIFSRENYLELQYLNPVIFYRTVEQFVNSPDNVILGLNARYNVTNRIKLYGQFVLDEFNLSILLKDNSWWGNKYGYQFGTYLYEPAGVKGLTMRIEYNQVRPYTYSHFQGANATTNFKSTTSYSHYGMPLAHPLGANFRELVLQGRYQLSQNISLSGSILNYTKGLELADGKSYGGDILADYNARPSEYGIRLGQGLKEHVNLYRGSISYQFFPNAFIDADVQYRSSLVTSDRLYLGINLRINMRKLNFDY